MVVIFLIELELTVGPKKKQTFNRFEILNCMTMKLSAQMPQHDNRSAADVERQNKRKRQHVRSR
jgi:hypothetical protein